MTNIRCKLSRPLYDKFLAPPTLKTKLCEGVSIMFMFTHMSVINIHINVAFTLFSNTLIVNLEKLR